MRKLLMVLATATLLVTMSCQIGVSKGASCAPSSNGNPTGTDGTNLLACENGTWEVVMPLADTFTRMSESVGPSPGFLLSSVCQNTQLLSQDQCGELFDSNPGVFT